MVRTTTNYTSQLSTPQFGSGSGAVAAMRLASRDVKGVAAYLASDACQKVVVLTGAGVSCAAGIPDFRSPGGMYDTLRPELITATPQERAAMARDPTAVVLKDMFLQNQFPYHEVRRPFILGTRRQQWKATRGCHTLHSYQSKLIVVLL